MSDAAQRWDAARYAQTARFVTDLGAPLLEMLAPRAGERILDLGCGDGPLTKQIAERGCIVVGVDASPEMVRAACALGLDARVMDRVNPSRLGRVMGEEAAAALVGPRE